MDTAFRPIAVRSVFGISSLCLIFLFLFSVTASAQSTITGTVYDKQRNPLPDIEVELLDDLYRTMPRGRQRTDGSGRYQFSGLRNGNYTIRVYAFRYDLLDQSAMLEINTQNIRGGEGTGYFSQDFYLEPKKGGIRDAELSVVFAQEIPKEARSAFDRAIGNFARKRDDQAFADLKKAIEIFPTYYDALYRFGLELFARRQFMESASAFIKAVEVNPRSATSYYYMASALHNAGSSYNKAALTALKQAYQLAPASVQIVWLIGKIERSQGNFAEAEKFLLLAKQLATSKVPEIHRELAQLYANDLKRFGEAADELELYVKASKLSDEDEKKTKQLIADLRARSRTRD
jgi:tetratricopeptide (TPR) repeat protein